MTTNEHTTSEPTHGETAVDVSSAPGAPHVEHGHSKVRFWQQKTLAEMTSQEWESLCDGCGKCCLVKLIDDDTEELQHTRVACELLDIGSCRCANYRARHQFVPDCVKLDAEAVREIDWLPSTCAYRLIAEGKDLAWWHPLVSGSPESVHQAGVSVRSYAISETKVDDDYEPFFLNEAP